MILSLRAPVHHHNAAFSVDGGLCEDLKEEGLGDVVGARAGDQKSSRLEEFQSAEVDLLVAALGGRDAIAILRKGRRIENHHLKAAPDFVVFFQNVEGVPLAEGDVLDSIE